MTTISIVTPWKDHPELIPDYERAVAGAEVVIIDNASLPDNAFPLMEMTVRLKGIYLHNDTNAGFSAANNQGLAHASGGIVMFLNNDIAAGPGFLDAVLRDVGDGMLAGPTLKYQGAYSLLLPYLEGWCIAARREVWTQLGGWDAEAYPDYFWEDNDLCLRAADAGFKLKHTGWPVRHKAGQSMQSYLPWGEVYERNRATFAARVRPFYLRLCAEQGVEPIRSFRRPNPGSEEERK